MHAPNCNAYAERFVSVAEFRTVLERELMHRRAAMLARAFDDLILEGILTDAGEGAADPQM
jgi:hypothetical protein